MAQEERSMDRFNLGAYGRTISTRSAETQRWFDIGLNWCYGFNHEEAIKCFRKALESDPGCAMVHWGIAYAAGPFYNLTWKEHGDAEANSATRRCFEHVQLARANAAHASPIERRLIEALGHRFQKPHRVTPPEFEEWDDAYAAEMRPVYASFPDDHDVMALFVEALMMRTVRRLWDLRRARRCRIRTLSDGSVSARCASLVAEPMQCEMITVATPAAPSAPP